MADGELRDRRVASRRAADPAAGPVLVSALWRAPSRRAPERDPDLPAVPPRLRARDWWVCSGPCGRILPVTAPIFPGGVCGDCYGSDTL